MRGLVNKVTFFLQLNSNIQSLPKLNAPFSEKWLGGAGSHNMIVWFDSDIDIAQLARIPILVGGNIANAPFLYLMTVDLINLTGTLSPVSGTAIISADSGNFSVEANKDNGDVRKLRIKVNNLKSNGMHVFVMVLKTGGTVTLG